MRRPTMPLLGHLLPAFAAELEAALRHDDEDDLAAQISTLPIKAICECGDELCASFLIGGRSPTVRRTGREVLSPQVIEGMVILEVVDGSITWVQVLERSSVREALSRAFPAIS